MAYMKNYYHVLGLETPDWHSKTLVPQSEIRKAYRTALLAAHPDKAPSLRQHLQVGEGDSRENEKLIKSNTSAKGGVAYSVDDVKKAYEVLGNETSRADFDRWLANRHDEGQENANDAVFLLGLELLDLNDFEIVQRTMSSNPPSGASPASLEEEQTEWTRSCRCGAGTGFRITEAELEAAEQRGEKEVLVGCEGCSLWVRVGFDVEEG